MAVDCVSRLTNALKLKSVDRVPVTSLMTSVTVDLMKMCGICWPDAHFDPDLMVVLSSAAFNTTVSNLSNSLSI